MIDILDDFYLKNSTIAEIAQKLDSPARTVEDNLYRAKKRLAEMLNDHLKQVDLYVHGVVDLKITKDRIDVDWVYANPVEQTISKRTGYSTSVHF